MRICEFPDCERKHYARGWCNKHWNRWWKYGDPTVVRKPERCVSPQDVLPARFWAKVDKHAPGGCWQWTGSIRRRDGYGEFSMKISPAPDDRRTFTVHRLAYIDARGPVPEGLVLDHLCRNRACCNPDHLEPVTNLENYKRGGAPTKVSRETGVCFKGHAMTPDNTYVKPTTGYRQCRICMAAYQRARRAS